MELLMKTQGVGARATRLLCDLEGAERWRMEYKVFAMVLMTWLTDPSGRPQAMISKSMFFSKSTYSIEIDGKTAAKLKPQWTGETLQSLEAPGLGLRLEGDLAGHAFQVLDSQGRVRAAVQPQGEDCRVQIEDEGEALPVLALLAALERILGDRRVDELK